MTKFLRSLMISALAALSLFVAPVAVEAQQINQTVAVCDPTNPTNCLTPTSGGASPMMLKCIYMSTLPTYTNGQTTDCQSTDGGGLLVGLGGLSGGGLDAASNATLIFPYSSTAAGAAATKRTGLVVAPIYFNGATWDRQRGDLNGAWMQGNVASGATDAGSPVKVGCVFNTTLPTVASAQRVDSQCDSRGGGIVVIKGAGGAAQTEVAALAGATTINNGPGAIYSSSFNRYWDTTATNWVSTRGTVDGQWVNASGTSDPGVALTNAVTAAVASNIVAKGTPGNFYGANLTSGASAGFFMLFNATTAPADGAVTPLRCWTVAANATLAVNNSPPIRLGTGITMVFSTTGCFTKTASATAFMSIDFE